MWARVRLSVLRSVAVAVSALLFVGALAASPASAAKARTAPGRLAGIVAVPKPAGGDVGYAMDRPMCATELRPGQVSCFGVQRVRVAASTPGARPYLQQIAAASVPDQPSGAVGLGPAGGFTPNDLAAAYRYDPTVHRSTQTVGIVDWFDDPHIAADLATFDTQYGLRAETASSFRKVNQNGARSPLPSSTHGRSSAGEIALDVESVRAVCQTCRILLVEAKSAAITDVATAENTAVRLGATEVSNAFGHPESHESKKIVAAFNHPGVVITAPTGDDGWYGWDLANSSTGHSQDAPDFPATVPTVVAVGGTALGLNADGSIAEQTVWNENGPGDSDGVGANQAAGASGGGCSTEFTAPAWQSHHAGYSAAHCAGKRLAADVSAVADPQTGFDVYDTWGSGDNGWFTAGGTSLASSVVAGMFALAGGAGGTLYPAASLYENAKDHPSRVFDVVATSDGLASGTGFCGGEDTATCGSDVSTSSGNTTHNPNALGGGAVDCSFPRDASDPAAPPPRSDECNTTTGYDGPSGVGTPLGTALFTPTSPAVTLRAPSIARFRKPTAFTAVATERLAGRHITGVTFAWGDGRSDRGTSLRGTHTYTRKGRYDVGVVVTDSGGDQSRAEVRITVGEPLVGKLVGPRTVRHGHKARFHVSAKDRNTGGRVKKVSWKWGDQRSGTGRRASHAWQAKGTYRVTATVTDNTGVRTRYVAHVHVT
jgi:PKD domain